MKNYTITVNGNVYEVTVEEGASTGAAPASRAAAPAPKAAPKAAAPAPAAGAQGSVAVTAPMPGKILGIKAEPGKTVAKGEAIIVLEAMKMENEIVAPQAGVVKQILVSQGTTVDTGDVLVVLN